MTTRAGDEHGTFGACLGGEAPGACAPDDLARQVRDALAHLHDPVYLQTHPLARRLARPGLTARSRQAGTALRQLLLDAIASLEPEGKRTERMEVGRGHRLLQLRFIEALDAEVVRRELGVSKAQYFRDHARALQALVSLLAERWPGAAAPAGPAHAQPVVDQYASRAAPAVRLPAPVTSFVGRERELQELTRLLDGRSAPEAIGDASERPRLVTLIGIGGCGKTRLTLQAAAGLVDAYPDGVRFVDLAPLADPGMVPQGVAAALGVPEQPGRPPATALADALASSRLLLILDNCEHHVAAAPAGNPRERVRFPAFVDALLRACPHLRILATSRQALGIGGEFLWPVPPLAVPPPPGGRAPPADEVLRYDAVRLFLARAHFSRPNFTPTADDIAGVAAICRRLDGLPLAIELAAARVRMLSIAQIAARLDDRFRLLIGGSRTAPERHQTLRAALDWSYDLLPDPERHLFEQLAVFAGDFSIEAVEAVCSGQHAVGSAHPAAPARSGELPTTYAARRPGGFRGPRLPADQVLEGLTALVDRSLVVVEWQGPVGRYRLLQTVRAYALERLEASGEAEAVRGRHAGYYLALAERFDAEWRGPRQLRWLDRLDRERDNLRSALAWSAERREVELGLRLAAAVWRFWWVRGTAAEGRRWLESFLALAPDGPDGARLKAPKGEALFGAWLLAMMQGDYAGARALGERALAAGSAAGDEHEVAWGHFALGALASAEGDAAAARPLLESSLAVQRRAGDSRAVAWTLLWLGRAAIAAGDHPAARRHLEEAVALQLASGDELGASRSMQHLGAVAAAEGRYATAHTLLANSLAAQRRAGDLAGLASLLEDFAALAAAEGQPVRALRLAGAAGALRNTAASPLPPALRRQLERALVPTRRALGTVAREAALAEGRALTLEQALAYASAVDEVPPPAPVPAATAAVRHPGGRLTVRERQVAGLVAQGRTNREIAAHLVISERTVEAHVEHIRSKLRVHSRAQIAAWAVAQGLAAAPRG